MENIYQEFWLSFNHKYMSADNFPFLETIFPKHCFKQFYALKTLGQITQDRFIAFTVRKSTNSNLCRSSIKILIRNIWLQVIFHVLWTNLIEIFFRKSFFVPKRWSTVIRDRFTTFKIRKLRENHLCRSSLNIA